VDIQTILTQESDPSKWPATSLPIEPYFLGDLPPGPWEYLDGPITPHLFRICAGDAESVTAFVAQFGFLELYNWAAGVFRESDSDAAPLWTRTMSLWEAEGEDPGTRMGASLRALTTAWEHPDTVSTFTDALSPLKDAWSTAADRNEPIQTAIHRFAVYTTDTPLSLTLSSSDGTLTLRPSHVVARSWIELLHVLQTRRIRPVVCEHCGQLFPPRRNGQRFCPGTSCRADAYRPYEQSDYRREYQRMYKRYRRGSITVDEWDAWVAANPGPTERKAD
jgi:hypothetical protein